MKVWCDVIYDSGIAATAGTFDKINSNADEITIDKPSAATIIGFLVNYVPTAGVDGEITPDLILQVNSKALGIQEQEYIVGSGTNDWDANSGYVPVETRFIPFHAPPGKQLFNADLKFKATASASTSNGLDVVVGVIYSDFIPDGDFKLELLSQQHGPFSGGVYAADAAKAHATGGTAVNLTKLTVPTGARLLRGIYASIIPNGITAGDPIAGFMEFTATGIQDFSPQKWPLNRFFHPALGTVTDGKNAVALGRYYPTRFDLAGQKVDINVASTLLTAAGTAPDTIQGVIYD